MALGAGYMFASYYLITKTQTDMLSKIAWGIGLSLAGALLALVLFDKIKELKAKAALEAAKK